MCTSLNVSMCTVLVVVFGGQKRLSESPGAGVPGRFELFHVGTCDPNWGAVQEQYVFLTAESFQLFVEETQLIVLCVNHSLNFAVFTVV